MDWGSFLPDWGPVGWGAAGLVGLGLGSDIFSNIQRQKVYNQQQALLQRQQDPNYWKQFYQPASDAYLQNLTRDVNAGLALRGIESGGEANLAISRAMAENEMQRQQQAMNLATGQLGAQGGTLSNMAGMYGQGGTGGTATALSMLPWLMLMQGQRTPGQTGTPTPSPSMLPISDMSFVSGYPNPQTARMLSGTNWNALPAEESFIPSTAGYDLMEAF